MNKIIKCASAVILAAVMLCGCNTESPKETNSSSGDIVGAGTTSTENTGYDKSEIPVVTMAKSYKASYSEFSKNDVLPFFSGTPKAVREEEGKNGSGGAYAIYEYELDEEYGRYNKNPSGSTILYRTKRGEGLSYISEGYDVKNSSELGFMTREKVAEKLSEIIKPMVNTDISADILPINAEEYGKLRDDYIKQKNELYGDLDNNRVSSDDYPAPVDFYFIKIYQSIDNIPFASICGYAIFTESGLEYLYLTNIIKISEPIGENQVLSLADAEKIVNDKYDQFLVKDPVTFISAQLVYNISGDLIPVWTFVDSNLQVTQINAITGKEIITDTGWGA